MNRLEILCDLSFKKHESTVQEIIVVTQSIVCLHRGQLATVIELTAVWQLVANETRNALNETARTIDRLSRFLTETSATRFSSRGFLINLPTETGRLRPTASHIFLSTYTICKNVLDICCICRYKIECARVCLCAGFNQSEYSDLI